MKLIVCISIQVEAEIARASAAAAAAPATAPAGSSGMSFSIPGPIKIDHLELPGGKYSLNLGAGAGEAAAAAPAVAESPAAVPAVAESPAAAPAVAESPGAEGVASAPSAPSPADDAEEEDDGVLNKRKDMHVDLDEDAVKQAASDLKNKYVSAFEAGGEDGAAVGDEETAGAALDDVLDTAANAAPPVDENAMRAAAEDLQNQVVSDANSQSSAGEEGSDDVLDSAAGMDTGVDLSAVQAAAKGILESTLAGHADTGSKEGSDDVLDSAAGMNTGVDTSAVQAAAKEILESTLAGHADAGSDEKSAHDDILDSSKMMDSAIDRAAVKAAADELLKAKLGDGDVLNSVKKMDRGVDGTAVAKAAKTLENEVIATKKHTVKAFKSASAHGGHIYMDVDGGMQHGTGADEDAEWGKKGSALAKEIQRKLKRGTPVHGQVSNQDLGLSDEFKTVQGHQLRTAPLLHLANSVPRTPHGKRAQGHQKALKSRFQMLSDTMLM
jgi:hypothetical protein